uniref:Fe2OG dioxygenase domain-containing protein n=2 Tax=Pseudo-nitzschia australis TaxID=44445 RepID=A0A7S4AC15_9STRA|mmetsp:Transcript_27902/g.61461  ORF Transcript_27902/g.61461 Transcript_27902/m.61461 type:complete len:467 (-) Transcript_27902:267-1667(-)
MFRIHVGVAAFWQYRHQLVAFALLALSTAMANTERGITIINNSGSRVEVYWVHPHTGQTSLMSNPHILNGAEFPLNSFVGHKFELREMPTLSTGLCKSEDQTCRNSFFVVSQNREQVVTAQQGFDIEFLDDQIRAQLEANEIVGSCQTRAKYRLQKAGTNTNEIQSSMDDLVKCVEAELTETLSRSNEELAFQSKIRTDMAELMENYTCVDTELNTTKPIRELQWYGARDRQRREVEVLLERPASKIMFVNDFISQAECDAMTEAAAPKLHKATVADGKGGSHFSEHRKALQAGIKVNWEKEGAGDKIPALSRRVYDFTNFVLDLDITEHGQEDLMSIQYFGRGLNDTEPDRYTPHCDGDCTGLQHKSATRMATMVMYCSIPEVGGHTNFRNAGIHVKPTKGGAVFFSYIDPEKRTMDKGFTEHSGCPVLVGEKKIVTQWIRLGVDDDNPWDSLNSLGLKHSEDDY